jgi:hypothetical protein
MKIISHRGYWKSVEEKNKNSAFIRSFELGYGTETDIRDLQQCLLISHDMPLGDEITFSDLLHLASRHSEQTPLTLALNIKADGLALAVRKLLDQHPSLDCFVFDMSVPDMRSYFDAGVPVFTRMSEVEQQPAWLERSVGVWLDSFESEWYDLEIIDALLKQGKRVCLVSPELHRRPHLVLWAKIAELAGREGLVLCTDMPEEATEFFYTGKK